MRYILSSLERLRSRPEIKFSGLIPEKLAKYGKSNKKVDFFMLNVSKYNKKHKK